MILSELVGHEDHPAYQALEISNGNRQYSFLRSIVAAALATQRPFLSTVVIKALNYHAITCLHVNAGEYRPCQVLVGKYEPPAHYRVQALMDDMVNQVNRRWDSTDPVYLATWVLWRMNWIHPFINGNGRTARAVCYFILCVCANVWLPGTPILPELIRRNRDEYIAALQVADASVATGSVDLSVLHALISKLLSEQLSGAGINPTNPGPPQSLAAPPQPQNP
jgi:hypothetical protein